MNMNMNTMNKVGLFILGPILLVLSGCGMLPSLLMGMPAMGNASPAQPQQQPQPLGAFGNVPSAIAPLKNTTIDEKLLYTAEATFAGADTVLNGALDAKLLKGTRLKLAYNAYEKAHSALLLMRKAQKFGDGATYNEQFSIVQDIGGQVWAIVKGDE